MWFGVCDLKTGRLVSELPLSLGGELQRGMQTITSGNFTLPVRDIRCPQDWETITTPLRYWIIAVDETSGAIVWGGIIESRQRKSSECVVGLACVSPEGYLDRRFVPAKRFDQVDQTKIVSWFVAQANRDGVPIVVDGALSGVLRDREYHDDDAATIYQRLGELSNVINGPEWHISVEWADDSQTRIIPVMKVGAPRIGRASRRPMAVFELPGGLLDVSVEERFGGGEFATHVLALGGGEGEDRPISNPQIAADVETAGWPRCEVRKTFDSVTRISTLNSHASSLLNALQSGVQVWSLSQKLGEYPLLGVDYGMGDDVRLIVNTDTIRVDTVLRVVGWSLNSNMQTITPHVAKIGGEDDAAAVTD